MSVIAVAGGTGKLGRAIVDALIAQGKATVIVLARESTPEKEKEIGARIIPVDYENVDSLRALLEENKIDTVIASINSPTARSLENNLITAADESSTTKRYIPSTWGGRYHEHLATYFPPGIQKVELLAQLEASSLEWTTFVNGFFTDMWTSPKVKSYLDALPLFVDIASNTAAVPGSGDDSLVFSHTVDVAQYVAALTTLPKWKKESLIVGARISLNEFVRLVEEIKGDGTKFTVHHDSLELYKSGKITELTSQTYLYPFFPKEHLQGFFAAFGRMVIEKEFELQPTEGTMVLNDQFPEIKARGVRQLLSEALQG